jgi:hypothetical protein
MKKITQILGFITLFAFGISCEKDAHVPPVVKFKTGTTYTSADKTVAKNTAITVGISADKVEDNLKTLNVSYAYDGATTTTTKQNFDIPAASIAHFEQDVTITTRATAGTEKWTFTVTDQDGNITPLSLTLTVQ